MQHLVDTLRALRRHLLASALAAAGIALAALLMVTVASLYASLVGSVERFGDRLAGGADVEVLGPFDGGLSEADVATAAAAAGAQAAIPVIATQVVVDGERTMLVGLDERASSLEGALSSPGLLRAVTSLPLGVVLFGPAFDAVVAEETHTLYTAAGGGTPITSVGVIDVAEARAFNGGRFVLMSLAGARSLLGLGERADSIYVIGAEGVRSADLAISVDAALGDHAAVASTGLRVRQVAAVANPIRIAVLLAGSASFAIAGVLIFDAVAISVERRRRELAVLRTIGATQPQLTRGIVLEAAAIGVVGGTVGVLLGLGAARVAVSKLPPFLVSAFGVDITFTAAWWSVPAAVVLGIATASVAGWAAARRVAGLDPADALRAGATGQDEVAGSSRRITGLVAVVLGVVAIALAGVDRQFTGIAAVGCVVLAVAAVAWAASPVLVASTTWLAGRIPRVWLIATASMRSSVSRTSITATVVAIAVSMVVMSDGLVSNQVATVRTTLAPLAEVPLVVDTNPGNETPATVLLPDAWLGDLDAIPGISVAGAGQFTFVTYADDRVVLEGVSGPASQAPAYRLADLAVRDAIFAGDAAIVSSQFVERYGVDVGSSVVLQTSTGPHEVHVVDVVASAAWPNGLMAVSLDRAQTWYRRPGVSFIELGYDGSVAPKVAREAVESFVGIGPVPAFVLSGREQVDRIAAGAAQAASALRAVEMIMLIVMAMVVLNAQVSALWQRQREFSLVRAIGGRRIDVVSTMVIEVACITAGAAIIGLAGGVWAHALASKIAETLSGFPVIYEASPLAALVVVPAAVLVAVAGSALPARWVSRIGGVDAFGD